VVERAQLGSGVALRIDEGGQQELGPEALALIADRACIEVGR
jgi:hypothetical protein